MYLHLGQDDVVPLNTVIGIFDLDITSQSKITRDFLRDSEKAGVVINVSDELPKSFVVCSERKKSKVFISQLSSVTLQKRSHSKLVEWDK